METLIAIAAHGPEWIDQLRESLTGRTGDAQVLVLDTGNGDVPGADAVLHGGHPTGAYRWAYEHHHADRYLFLQDSMTVLDDVLPWFEQQQIQPGGGVVAWGWFPMQWDDPGQATFVQSRYPGVTADRGIFGPVFYADRASLDVIYDAGLMPPPATSRWEAQASERAWGYACVAADVPIFGPEWHPQQMRIGWGPLSKVWAGRL